MKTLAKSGLIFFLWMLLILPGGAEPLYIISLEQPPMHYEEQGAIKGIATDIVVEAFNRMGQPIRMDLYPFIRSMSLLRTGDADGIFAIVRKQDRELFLNFPEEVLINQTAVLLVRKDSPIEFDGDLQKLNEYTFGVLRGATYGPQWEKAVKTGEISRIEEVAEYSQNVLKLMNHHIDIMIGPRLSMLNVIKNMGYLDAVRELDPSIESVPTYLAFSKTRVPSEIIKQFEKSLKEMKEDGTYERILRSYIE